MENGPQRRLKGSVPSGAPDRIAPEELRASSSHSKSSRSDFWLLSHHEELEKKEKAAATILRIADLRAMDQEAKDLREKNRSVTSIQYFVKKMTDSAYDAINYASALVESKDFRHDAFYHSGINFDKAQLYARRAGFGSNEEYSEDALREVNKATLLYLVTKGPLKNNFRVVGRVSKR